MASNESPEEIEELDSVHVDALLKAVEKAGEKPNTTVFEFHFRKISWKTLLYC
mgnify:CR=1 FL=1